MAGDVISLRDRREDRAAIFRRDVACVADDMGFDSRLLEDLGEAVVALAFFGVSPLPLY